MNEDTDKYANFSRDELVAEIKRLKKNKKYGLVWEHKTEKVIEDFETQQPYLQEVTEKRIENVPGEPTNLIIEGDNFEALSILNYTHAGKVDVIYIDPPYNTGNKDFIYNDNYVDSEDEFRHSKWLSFMEPRLKLAKNLLKDDGVIFISIDDNEQAALKLLCESIFGKENCINTIIWYYRNSTMKSSSEKLAKTHEYILVCRKSDKFRPYPLRDGEISQDLIKRFGKYADENMNILYKNVKDEPSYLSRILPKFRKEYGREPEDDDVLQKLEPNYVRDVIERPTIRSNDFEAKFNVAFQNPKNPDLMSLLIRLSSKDGEINKRALVLDFFAGSGTTGQAVLELNKEDGGHRQFILCTNNGDKGPDSVKIAEDITYPRMKTVITGERQDGSKYSDGIPANLRYYKIGHKEKKASIDANRLEIVRYLEDIIQVKENAFEQIEVNEDLALYKNSERFVGMVFEPFALEEIIESIEKKNAENLPVKLYVFSYSRDAFEDNYETDFEIEFVAMPEGLLKTYANIVAETKKEDV